MRLTDRSTGFGSRSIDDGRGIGEARAGVGLSSMRERAAELGGSCSVGAAEGGGTMVRAELPLGEP